jgi:hypothetical protein
MQLIQMQERYNRVNTSNPFGSQRYSTGADGRTEFTTTLSPQMQQLMDRGMGLAGRDMQRVQKPQGFEELVAAMMGRLGNRFGSKP